jgi:hypothetical protein
VLYLLLWGGEGGLVLDIAQREVAPSLEEQIGVALGRSDRLDEEVVAGLGRDRKRRGSPGIDDGRCDLNGLDTRFLERSPHGGARRSAARCAPEEVECCPHHPPESGPTERVNREVGAHEHAR